MQHMKAQLTGVHQYPCHQRQLRTKAIRDKNISSSHNAAIVSVFSEKKIVMTQKQN